MSVIKETIKFNNQDINLKFVLGSGDGFLGYQQEVDNLTTATANALINSVVDAEVRKFIYKSSVGATNLKFYFDSGSTRGLNFQYAGFSHSEINIINSKILNSFFILDFYDSYNANTQIKIFTTYLTKILDGTSNTPNYKIYNDTINQFYCWYVPISYIEVMKLSGNTATGYTKFSFYNAKTGEIDLFYNKDNDALLTPEKMYFKTELDLINMTWKFLNLSSSDAKAYEVSSTSAYVNRVNNTFNNFENKKQVYPTGNTFQSTNGTYINE